MANLLALLRDEDLSPQVLDNGADRPWWGAPALAVGAAVVFWACHYLFSTRAGLISFMPGDMNRTAGPKELATFLAVMWVFVVAGWFVPAAYKRSFLLLASLATAPILIPPTALAMMPLIGLLIYFLVNSQLPTKLKWLNLLGFWVLFYLAHTGAFEPVIVARQLHTFAVLAFFAVFLKSVFYLFEKTTLLAGKPDARPLRKLMLYLFAGPFFLVPFHIKPIGYGYLHGQLLARKQTLVMRDGVILFGQGILYLVIRTYLFSHWLDWHGPLAVQDLQAQLPGWQILLFAHYNFLRIFLELAGSVYLIIGLWRMFGFDLKADFYFPFFAKNLLEHWRRWNIYNRDFVVATIFNPVLLTTGRKLGRYWAYMLACILCFFIGLGVVVHLIPMTFHRGDMHFAYPVLVRSGFLGVLTGLNIWLSLFMAQKGRNRKLREKIGKFKILGHAIGLAKIYFTFSLMSGIYMIQQGLTSGLKMTEVFALLARIFYQY
jgi:D-alanyl-lipoteichoic acid acyltransferase DltB (MBOAT superfamily)